MSDEAAESPPTVLRLGTRGSLLARMQSQLVANELEKRHPGVSVDLRIYKTSGDTITDRPLHELGGKGLFTKELELALLNREIDVAVHSFKDLPVTMPLVDESDLVIAAVPRREDPRDVLVSAAGQRTLAELPAGARIGTTSLRRRCQILALRQDLSIEPMRGNIDTRLKKQAAGEYDAIVLAMAGLVRTNLFDTAQMVPIELDQMLPAAGQGALAVQCRRDAADVQAKLSVLHDPVTAACVDLERAIVRELHGDCRSPIAVLASVPEPGDGFVCRAVVGARGGELPLAKTEARAPLTDPDRAVSEMMAALRAQDVEKLLAG